MDEDERAAVKATFDVAMKHYTEKPEEARLANDIGELKVDEKLPAVELAAWSIIASQLFNLDETVTR
jgi:hypothetical protein